MTAARVLNNWSVAFNKLGTVAYLSGVYADEYYPSGSRAVLGNRIKQAVKIDLNSEGECTYLVVESYSGLFWELGEPSKWTKNRTPHPKLALANALRKASPD